MCVMHGTIVRHALFSTAGHICRTRIQYAFNGTVLRACQYTKHLKKNAGSRELNVRLDKSAKKNCHTAAKFAGRDIVRYTKQTPDLRKSRK